MGRKPRAPRHRASPDPQALQLGVRVRALRKERGVSFDAFVESCGLGRGYVSELERGLVVPSLTALTKLARALELTPADLVLGSSLREQLFEVTARLPETEVAALLRDAQDREAGRSTQAGRQRRMTALATEARRRRR